MISLHLRILYYYIGYHILFSATDDVNGRFFAVNGKKNKKARGHPLDTKTKKKPVMDTIPTTDFKKPICYLIETFNY